MTTEHSRRKVLRWAAVTGAAGALTPLVGGRAYADPTPSGNPWARTQYISAKVRRPYFPDRWFDITRYGAVGDGATDCTAAIRRAVEACHGAGGGHVLVPAGRFLAGPIHLLSNVDLHVTADAVVLFSQNPADYLPAVLTRFEGVELYNYSPLIYADGQENIGVTGAGVLDGQADNAHWWPWKGKPEYGWKPGDPKQDDARARLFAMAEQGVPVEQRVFGEGDYLRSSFVEPYRCRNVLIEGVTIVRSPMWEIHPTLSTNVLVQGVTVDSHGPNNDGCDPESCRDVLIEGCTFDTGDDCIAIKSGRNAEGRRVPVPTENVIVRNCRMQDGHGGVTIGSEITAGVRNVFVEHCEMDSPNLERALRFKNNAMRGGTLEHVYMRDVRVGEVADAVLSMDLFYEEGERGPYVPVIRDVEMRNVTSRKSRYALYMRAYPKSEISDVRIIGCTFDGVARGNVTEGVQRLELRDVRINGAVATATSHEAKPTSDGERLPSDMRAPAKP